MSTTSCSSGRSGSTPYGVGFHDVRGIQATLKLDEELVKSVRLVGP